MARMSRKELSEQTGIREQDLYALHLLERAIVPDLQTKLRIQLTLEEKGVVIEFLERSIANVELNQQMLALQKNFKSQDVGIDFAVIDIIKDISYKTRHWSDDRINPDSVYEQFNWACQGKKLEKKNKLTLAQFGALTDLVSVFSSLNLLHQSDLLPKNSALFSLYEKAQKAKEMVGKLQENLFWDFEMAYGAVVIEDKVRKNPKTGKSMSITQRLLDIEENHEIVGLTKEMHSRINGNHKKDKFSLMDFLYNDVYRLKLDKLIDLKVQGYLKEHLGDDWLEQMEKKFGEIQRDRHDTHLLSPIAARLRLRSAEITDWYETWHYSLTASQFAKPSFFMPDHSNMTVRDMVFARKQFNNQENTPIAVLCSQFISVSLSATIQELNVRMTEELINRGADEDELPETIIQSFISENGYLSPQQLIDFLDNHDALERVPSPESMHSSTPTQKTKKGTTMHGEIDTDDDDSLHM